jgi:hypothetical protein
MTTRRSIVAVLAVLAVLAAVVPLVGCDSAGEPRGEDSPVTLKAVEGTDLFQVSLTELAEQRLGVATDVVRAAATATAGATANVTSTIPYAAVVYDGEGASWTYTKSAPHTYVRAEVSVDRIEGDVAMLTAGPVVGTAVVVVGATELLGAEMQIAGEE